MASGEQKQTNRLSLSLSLLSPKKKKSTTPNKKIYISSPLNSFGPSGQSLGINHDDVMVPLRVHCEIFGPSVHYKSVGVTQTTTAVDIIQNLFQKMSRVGEQEMDCSLTEFCLAEICILTEFAYLRLLENSANPLLLYQQHSKRYKSADNWRLKLILRSQLKSNASSLIHSLKRDLSLVYVTVDCDCLEDSYLSVSFLLPQSTTCEKIINKIVTEFAYIRQPDDFSLHFPALCRESNDQMPNALTLDYLQKQSGTDVIELILRYKYEDIADEYDIENTEPLESSNPHRDYPNPKYSEQSTESEDAWVEYYDSTREKIYYINSNTEEIIWVHPATQQEMYLDSDMPPGWVRGVERESGRVFYQNTFDKKIDWSHPLRHLHRIYKQSLQPVSNTSLPRPMASVRKPPTRCPPPPPVPLSARPTLALLQSHQHSYLLPQEKQSRSLNSSNQSISDEVERASSDAVLLEFVDVSGRQRNQRKNKRLNNLRRLLVNEKYSDDSDTVSIGSGHKIKSLFTSTNRKKQTDGTLPPGISVTVTPDPSPVGRKKSIVSVGSSASEKSFPTNTQSSLPRNFSVNNPGFRGGHERNNSFGFTGLPEETAVIFTHQNSVTEESAFARSVSELEQNKHTAATALDEAFSLLDGNRSSGSFTGGRDSEVIVNKNAHISEKYSITRGQQIEDNSLDDCFEVIGDSSFDEGSDQDMFYPTKEYTVVVESGDSMERNSYTREGPLVSDISVANKISLFEQKLFGDSSVTQDMNALLSVPVGSGEGQDPRDRTESAGSVSSDGGSLKSEDTGSVEGSTSGRTKNALRTKKGRMSRNTSALNHQELELLNKGVEPQKSILKHSRSDIEENNDKKYKGVSFLSTSVQMIEIERRRDSGSCPLPELDTHGVIHKRGVSNWRDMLKTFYDEVDKQGGKDSATDLVWSPDEGIGLVEEERFIQEANKLTVDQGLSHEAVSGSTEEEIINSLKQSLRDSPPLIIDSRPPQLPPRPTPDDIDNISNTSDSSRPPSTPKTSQDSLQNIAEIKDEDILVATDSMIRDVSGIMDNIISLADDAVDSMHKNKKVTEQQIDRSNRAFIDSFICPGNETGSTVDSSGVTDSGMFSLEVSTNMDELSPRREDTSLSLTQLVFNTLSGTLADSASNREPFTSLSMVHKESPSRVELPLATTDEPVVVSSLVEPITLNAMIPMNVFLPKERPTLLREQIRTRTPLQQPLANIDSPRDETASIYDTIPSPVPISPSAPHKHLQALTKTRSASPVLVDQLNKPLSGTPFIYGYQYQRKPANKSATLYSGYLALVEQQTVESKQKAKKYSN